MARDVLGEIAGIYGTTKLTTGTGQVAVSGFTVWSDTATVVDIKRKYVNQSHSIAEVDFTDYDGVELQKGETITAGFMNGQECYFSIVTFAAGGRATGFNIDNSVNKNRL